MSVSDAVSALYSSILGRSADNAGLNAAVAAVNARLPLATLGASLAASPEAHENELGVGFPSNAQLAASTQAIISGSSLSNLRATFAATPQAQSVLTRLFQVELGRAPDGTGLAAFTQALVNGASDGSIRLLMATSAEATSDIGASYQAATGSAPNTVEVAASQSELAGGVPLSSVRAEVAELSGGKFPTIDGATIPIDIGVVRQASSAAWATTAH